MNQINSVIKFIVIFLAAVLLTGCNFWGKKKEFNPSEAIPAQGSSVRNEDNGIYDIYTAELAAAKDKKIILFFSAVGCKECRELENDIQSNRGSIPKEMIILNIDSDVNVDLKEKYNITEEGSLVQVDSKGKEIKKLKAITLFEIINSV